jgi:hypothetical protein
MPEDLEKVIAPADMCDLITYLVQLPSSESPREEPLDIGTEPGLVEPNSRP